MTAKPSGTNPVSSTHLDVYKRQVHYQRDSLEGSLETRLVALVPPSSTSTVVEVDKVL